MGLMTMIVFSLLAEVITAWSNDNDFRTTSDNFRRAEAAAAPVSWAAQRAPPSWVAFGIGGILFIISTFMWVQRVKILKDRTTSKLSLSELLRGMIACAIDNDSPSYTITSYAAVSFLFLGGIQTNYQITFIIMISYYCITSFGDSLRVLLAYKNYNSLSEVLLFSKMDTDLQEEQSREVKIGKKKKQEEEKISFQTTEVVPRNIYEDIGRERTIVYMIFSTQIILVCFLCIDIYNNDTIRCPSSNARCLIGDTMGSYFLYILGIFQACVYLLGPKTAFGQSEQNPGFWLIMLLASKQGCARLLWEDPIRDPSHSKHTSSIHKDSNGTIILDEDGNPKLYHCYDVSEKSGLMWRRFMMSFLVNGIGFHILIHALPIQLAAQSTLTGAVFRAVGMMYLVDLDDTKGFTLIITTEPKEVDIHDIDDNNDDDLDNVDLDDKDEESPDDDRMEEQIIKIETEQIIREAQNKLQGLLKSGPSKRRLKIRGHSIKNIMEFGSIPATKNTDQVLLKSKLV